MKRRIKPFYILIMSVLCAAFSVLGGCKPSPAFTQTLYTDFAEETDERANASTLDNSPENTEKDPVIPPQEFEDDFGTERDRERKNAVASEEAEPEPEPETAPMPENSEDAKPDENLGISETPQEEASSEEDETLSQEEGGIETLSASKDENESLTRPDVSENTRQIVDAAGRTVDIPEKAERVAAVGEAATLVRMLGGEGRLAASSASLGTGLCGEVFPDDCPKLWGGDGSSPLSDEAFACLLEAAPQACFEISGQTSFTEEQITALGEAGVAYIVLPDFASDSGIRLAVSIIGRVLDEYNGVDANERAEKYLAFHDKALGLVASRVEAYLPDGADYDSQEAGSSEAKGEGITALYIDGWDYEARYSLHDDSRETLSGSGLPVIRTGYRHSPLTYYLSLAGVANFSALRENNYSLNQPRLKYINPVITPNKTLTIEGGVGAAYDTYYVYTSAGGAYLGESAFPAVIAASADIKKRIEESPLWKDYGIASSATGLTYGYGFTDQNGNIVSTTIHGPYDVFVLPSGVGSWAEGSAESVLTASWAAWKLRGVVTEDEVKALVREFYESFYGCSLSEGRLDELLCEGQE